MLDKELERAGVSSEEALDKSYWIQRVGEVLYSVDYYFLILFGTSKTPCAHDDKHARVHVHAYVRAHMDACIRILHTFVRFRGFGQILFFKMRSFVLAFS